MKQPEKWLDQFLESRNIPSPDGRMLFRYRLTNEEYSSLKDSLHFSMCMGKMNEVALKIRAFPALFVLYAAEWCRREYDGGHWRWEPIIDSFDGEAASESVRSEVVCRGLAYWGHKPGNQGKKYIGAMIAQSGLPLRLIQRGEGSIAELMKRTLKQALRFRLNKTEIAEKTKVCAESLPNFNQHIRIPETYELIAEMVETTIKLRRQYKLDGVSDPIQILDSKYPDWHNEYPLQLDDSAAKALLEGLVKEAAIKLDELSGSLFSLERWLAETPPESGIFRLHSRIIHKSAVELDTLAHFFQVHHLAEKIPNNFSIDADVSNREPVFEVRRILGEETSKVVLQGDKKTWRDTEACDEHMLYLRTRQDSSFAGPIPTPGGIALDFDEPWVFVEREKKWVWLTSGGAKVPEEQAWIMLPERWRIQLDATGSLARPAGKCVIADRELPLHAIQGKVTLQKGNRYYRVQTHQPEAEPESYVWAGKRLLFYSRPGHVFLELPKLYRYRTDCDPEIVPSSEIQWGVAGEAVADPRSIRGPVEAKVFRDGEPISRFQLFILDSAASIRFTSGQTPGDGEIVLSGFKPATLAVDPAGVNVVQSETDFGYRLNMSCADVPPESIAVCLSWPSRARDLLLMLPFPSSGGRFFDGAGKILGEKDTLAVRRLMGARLQIFDGNPEQPKKYEVILRLIDGNIKHPIEKNFSVPVENGRAEARLIDWQRDIEMFMGLSDKLDAQVELLLRVGGKPASSIRITRYDTVLEQNGRLFSLPARCMERLTNEELMAISCQASPLMGGDGNPIELAQEYSEGVLTGSWRIRGMDGRWGPWLIYPGENSLLRFRPAIWHESLLQPTLLNVDDPLVAAMLVADSEERKSAIEAALATATQDYNNPSWKLLEYLWRSFRHLPLSSIDVWRRLAVTPSLAVHVILRLEIDEEQLGDFLHRLHEKLGCMLELAPVEKWRDGIVQLKAFWTQRAGENVALNVIEARLQTIKRHVPSIAIGLDFFWFQISLKPTENMLEIERQRQRNRDAFTEKLWKGGDSLLQTVLLRNHANEDWPEAKFFRDKALPSFERGCSRDIPDILLKNLFSSKQDDFKMSVVNLPVLCALWSATNTDIKDWRQPNWLLALRQIRNFDALWFDQAYHHAIAACLSYDLINQTA